MKPGLLQPVFAYFHRERPMEMERAKRLFFEDIEIDSLTLPNQTVQTFFGAWFLYDYRTETEKQAPLGVYIRANPGHQSTLTLRTLQNMLHTQFFDVFEIVSIERDRGMVMQQVRTGKNFAVRERLGTHSAEVGMLQMCRLMRYEDAWEFAGDTLTFASDSTLALSCRVLLEGMPKNAVPSSRDMLRIIGTNTEHAPSTLDSAKQAMDQFLYERDADPTLNAAMIVKWLIETHSIDEARKRSLLHLPLSSNEDLDAFLQHLSDLWNHLSPADRGADTHMESWKPGPLEHSLLLKLRESIQRDVDLNAFKTQEEVNEAIHAYQERWIDTPLHSLNNRTPRQAVTEERLQSGHPEKDWTVEVSVQRMPHARQQRADALYFEANALIGRKQYADAERLYRQLLQEEPQHYKAWGNLGIALSFQEGRMHEAIKALRKALAIEPEYQTARENLEQIQRTDADPTAAPPTLTQASIVRAADPGDALSEWLPLLAKHDLCAIPAMHDAVKFLGWLSENGICPITSKRREIAKRLLPALNSILARPDPDALRVRHPDGKICGFPHTREYQFPTLHRVRHLLTAMQLVCESPRALILHNDVEAFLQLSPDRQYCRLLWSYCRELPWKILIPEDRYLGEQQKTQARSHQSELPRHVDRLLAARQDKDGWIDLSEMYDMDDVTDAWEAEESSGWMAARLFLADSNRSIWEPFVWFGLLEARMEEDAFGFRMLTAVRLTVLGKNILPTIGYRAPSTSAVKATAQRISGTNMRRHQKVGRNDPCPCGSTRPDGTRVKYKKCCGRASTVHPFSA